jgi:acetyl esterase/lipase
VRAPTLVLHGSQDVMVPLANAELLADGIPGAELRVLSGSGHAAPLEHPEVSARLLVDWVQRHADVEVATARRREVIGERLARPFSLLSGTVRNTAEAAALVVRSR